VAIDAVIVTAFIYLTGGITSLFSSLYALPIIAASMMRFRRGGLFVGTLSAVMYTVLVLAQYQIAAGALRDLWFGAARSTLPSTSVAQFTVALNLFGFFAIALLSGSLAERVRSAGARLQRASTELQDLQAFNQDIINSLPSGLVTTDTMQRILTFNHAAEAITGLAFSTVVGRPVGEVLQLPTTLVTTLNEGLQGTGVRRLNVRFTTGDGRGDIAIGLSVTNLETPGGRTGFLVTFQDLTEIKKLERDVQMQQRLAAIGEMAAGIAHEIRNPLASMSGSIQILRQELPLTSEQEQLMDIVLRESERLNSTIRSFLAYARPQRFAIARFDVCRALKDTALLLRNSSEVQESHSIEVDIPDEPLLYEADEGQIRQIVWNLATNGLRAMPDGGRLRLGAFAEPASDAVVISVQDEGTGIAADELDGLFQPFRGSFAKGSGLGLAIVHRIVTDYHGEIQVSSQPGAGTTVSVRMPVRVEVTI
jgi:two-component system sensor histidine kinase PilS (NtrC family)